VDLINSQLDSATIFIFSVLPVDEKLVSAKAKISNVNDQINQLNIFLKEFARVNYKVYFLNTAK
jgi:hypothetical protein